MECTAIELPTI